MRQTSCKVSGCRGVSRLVLPSGCAIGRTRRRRRAISDKAPVDAARLIGEAIRQHIIEDGMMMRH